jgi:cellulose synthase/poly-beta-1,6-N-acetylglucosamine synthase-like glycosyltransferase
VPVLVVVFGVMVALIVYAYAGYPLLVAIVGYTLDRRVRQGPITPPISVVIAAYDEADGIGARIQNLLDSDYPLHRLQIVIASDGSTDDTVGRARAVGSPQTLVLDLPRRGKAHALAAGAARATGDILVFTDANTVFRRDALAMLARNFADPDVGGVAGHTGYVVPQQAESTGRGEDLYWRYDTWLKTLESRTGSVVSAHGGMYAIRRELFRPVEDPAVTDDFAISTGVVALGKRLVFEPEAIGSETTMSEGSREFSRRVRLMTRGWRGVLLRRTLLNPFRTGFYALALASRKVLRRLIPLTFVPILVAALVLAGSAPIFALVAGLQVAVVMLGGAGWVLRRTQVGKAMVLCVPLFFCLANLAAIVAFWRLVRGSRIERWTPQRHADAVLG